MELENLARDAGRELAEAADRVEAPAFERVTARRRRAAVATGAVVAAVLLAGVAAVAASLTDGPEPVAGPDATAPILSERTGSSVYLSTDNRLTVVDVDSAEATAHGVPELAPGDPQYRLVRRGDRLVFYGQTDAGPAAFAVDPDTPTEPVLIGDAWFFIPGATNDTIWLTELDESSPDTVRALKTIREVTVDGTVVTSDVAPPDGRWPMAAVEAGLLFQGEEELELWDPHTRQFIDSFPGPFPVATWRNRMVTCQRCDQLHLIDLETGTERVVELPPGVAAVDGYGGAFSDDGRYAAFIGYDALGPISPATAISVVLVDFDIATATTVPGIRTERSGEDYPYPQLAWNTDGTWLFFSVGNLSAETGQLFAFRPGDDTAYTVPVVLDGQYLGMAAR